MPVSILTSLGLVWLSTEGAFSDTSTTAPDSFTAAGGVNVTTDKEGQVVFGALTGLMPDDTLLALTLPGVAGPYAASTASNGGSKCVLVSYTGATANIRMYATVTGTLAPYVLFTVDVGGSATNNNCASYATSSTIYGASPNNSAYLNGLPANWGDATATQWSNVATGTSRWYRLSWLLPKGTSNASGGLSSTVTFTWEARNA
ncbi:hypothetical protein QLQ12_00230 [Actinoplanes sp. NEAU-A12]|uniref:Uncharacterized protein n=1 Tax=Actinoplanes sandaracinus TaxID=3045177 RepID=A0ABT6WBC4_9ACTN|nr:hypothetical protein [Actinoplanes sandaracinus]MDI6097033.1 hypothetical protein [Actinoplanes sandaracinus]